MGMKWPIAIEKGMDFKRKRRVSENMFENRVASKSAFVCLHTRRSSISIPGVASYRAPSSGAQVLR
jgi:hypothetical protein